MLQIVTTGGTIDKTYNPLTGELVFTGSALPKMLELMNYTGGYEITQLMQKDSLEMTHEDRAVIHCACISSEYQRIVLTHGTDTMVETAHTLSTIDDKTIVLTGAMIPYSISDSDAMLNVGFALGVVQTLPSGVYITMNGQVFNWNEVVKDRSRGMFVPKVSSR